MNTKQKNTLKAWPTLLRDFTKREWFSLCISSSLGVLGAEALHLLFWDHSFQTFLVAKYKPGVSFDTPHFYLPYLVIILVTLLLAIVSLLWSFFRRGLRSWLAGVTSGLILLPFASAFAFATFPSPPMRHRLAGGCVAIVIWFVVGFVLYLVAKIRADRTVHEDEFKVSPIVRSLAGTQLAVSDDPIQFWQQDALKRAALVDSISIKLMISKSPVLALSGEIGRAHV